jgi:hypothetical protein
MSDKTMMGVIVFLAIAAGIIFYRFNQSRLQKKARRTILKYCPVVDAENIGAALADLTYNPIYRKKEKMAEIRAAARTLGIQWTSPAPRKQEPPAVPPRGINDISDAA